MLLKVELFKAQPFCYGLAAYMHVDSKKCDVTATKSFADSQVYRSAHAMSRAFLKSLFLLFMEMMKMIQKANKWTLENFLKMEKKGCIFKRKQVWVDRDIIRCKKSPSSFQTYESCKITYPTVPLLLGQRDAS